MESRDYYAVLEVPRDATAAEIKRAFRKLARKYHPDVSKADDAGARMKAVNEAYATLSDPEKRAAYDREVRRQAARRGFRVPSEDEGGFGGFEGADLPEGLRDFESVFASLFDRIRRPPGTGPGWDGAALRRRGPDQQAEVRISVEEAFQGTARQVVLRMPAPGSGAPGRFTERVLDVKIPAGVQDGQRVRVEGQGVPGIGGGPPGDLFLEIRLEPHPRYRVDGRDVHLVLPVAPWEAALGAVIPVVLPGGELSVRIPASTRSGRELRVRGRGLPGTPPGDLWLGLQIVLPPADTPEARAFYESMARALPFDPRAEGRT